MEDTRQLLNNFDFSKFTVRPNQTLFELSAKEKKDLLIKRRCLVCCRKLRLDMKGNGRCVSKKNNCRFFIKRETLAKYDIQVPR